MSFSPTIFRNYDIRGIIGETLDAQKYFHLGQLLGSWAKEKGITLAVLGYDGRLSSPDMAQRLAQGVIQTGIDVLNVALVPTPALYYAQSQTQAGLALMVTGSHNPPQYNGLKIMMGGLPFYGKDIAALPERARMGKVRSGTGQLSTQDISQNYIDNLLNIANLPALQEKNLRIGWDAGNGAMGDIVTRIAARLPGAHFVINGDIDGTFPNHHPDPSQAQNMTQLQDLVAEKQLDFGIAFDGDGDRIGVVIDDGRILYGDQLLPILAFDVLQNSPKSVILADVKTSSAALESVRVLGGQVKMVPSGHSLVKMAMKQHDAAFAAEMSGHIFFRDNHNFDDALYAALKLMNRAALSEYSLKQLTDALPQNCSTPELRIRVKEQDKQKIMNEIIDYVRAQGWKFHDIDGMRIDDTEKWWLIRASNTENALIFRAEAKDDTMLRAIIAQAKTVLQKCGIDATILNID